MIEVQRASQSLIYWIGLATAVAQAVLGILLTAGVMTPEMCGAVMTAFAVVLQWANGNNPNVASGYNAFRTATATLDALPDGDPDE